MGRLKKFGHFLRKIGLQYVSNEGLTCDLAPSLLWHSLPHSVISGQGSQEATLVLNNYRDQVLHNRSGFEYQQTCHRRPTKAHQVRTGIEHEEVLETLV